ncbi:thioesterase [Iodidimonas nitroreducens]|uniref:Thioesterase n=1 Tax=Iodidimonas nitroreducens TaxID=1236968 RepID=A0A5A7N9W7_9PROT|nr:PaaI family thioesterase [Iodidimonas nitroreducens]GAK33951.1 putative domain 1 [alpha proteobacterium Q-1]GER03869.1 thioesterase [Iodidimonas nitroreducens]
MGFDIIRALMHDPHAVVALDAIPYARFLGLSLERSGDDVRLHLAFSAKHIGAPGRYHGGVLGAALEFAAMAELMWQSRGSGAELTSLPKPVTLTVDFLRPAGPQDLYAAASIIKQGSRIASVRSLAWQEDREKPVAEAQMHFLLPQSPAAPENLQESLQG